MDKKLLQSFPQTLVDEMLSRKVYSVMLSLPKTKQDAEEDANTNDENPPEPEDIMGVIEQRLSTIIYGEGGNPLSPRMKS